MVYFDNVELGILLIFYQKTKYLPQVFKSIVFLLSNKHSELNLTSRVVALPLLICTSLKIYLKEHLNCLQRWCWCYHGNPKSINSPAQFSPGRVVPFSLLPSSPRHSRCKSTAVSLIGSSTWRGVCLLRKHCFHKCIFFMSEGLKSNQRQPVVGKFLLWKTRFLSFSESYQRCFYEVIWIPNVNVEYK